MQYVNWSDAFLTGHHAIDADHKKLFSLIGDLYGYVAAEAAASRLESALDELVDYVHAHFAREEQLLQSTAYPDLENHKAAHAMLR